MVKTPIKKHLFIYMRMKKSWIQHHGKQLSYNNYYDIETAFSIVNEFNENCCVIIKHSNPCGFSLGQNPKYAYLSAVETDPVSYFGGIVAFNSEVDYRQQLK